MIRVNWSASARLLRIVEERLAMQSSTRLLRKIMQTSRWQGNATIRPERCRCRKGQRYLQQCVQPKPAGLIFTASFRQNEKFHDMGRKTIHIKRREKANHVYAGKQIQRLLKLLPVAEGQHFCPDI